MPVSAFEPVRSQGRHRRQGRLAGRADTSGLKDTTAVSNKVLIGPCQAKRQAQKLHDPSADYSLTKAADKASILLAPAPLESCRSFGVAKVTVHKPLSVTHQPSEQS